jgi:hypothetical protein
MEASRQNKTSTAVECKQCLKIMGSKTRLQ